MEHQKKKHCLVRLSFFCIIIYSLKKDQDILILWSAYLCYIQANTGCKTVHALCKMHIHYIIQRQIT